jgi:starch-binding outer membrane protein, SusD/RagB family
MRNTHMTNKHRAADGTRGRWRARGGLAALAGAVALGACDLGVSNPALIEDADLDRTEAIAAVVNGVRGDYGGTVSFGLGGAYMAGAVLGDELTHVGSWQPIRQISEGNPGWTEPENQSHWGYAQRGRWVAEDAIRRISALVANPQSDPNIAMVTLYAGLSNRMLGDHFCHAVIDGGPLEPNAAFHQRAVRHFTDAIAVGQAANQPEIVNAAYGGRAQAHMALGNWQAAVADAQRLPTNFAFVQPHSDNSSREHNHVHDLAERGDNGQQFSVWGTPFAQWGREVNARHESEGDPRASYRVVLNAQGNPQTFNFLGGGVRQLWYSQKYNARNAGIPLVKGTEMRLIEAEAALVGGNVAGAIAAINQVRTFRNLAPVSATSANQAWDLLQRERGVELWLEGRRLGDLRRWQGTPGFVNTQVLRTGLAMRNVLDTPQPLCLKVSSNEIFSNPNIPSSPYSN